MISHYINSPLDFVILTTYFLIGSTNVFVFPRTAYKFGFLNYSVSYCTALVLVGIPMFIVEISLSMPRNSSVWERYHSGTFEFIFWSTMIQYLSMGYRLGQSYCDSCIVLLMSVLNLNKRTLSHVKYTDCQLSHFAPRQPCEHFKSSLASCYMRSLIDAKRQAFAVTTGYLTVFFTLYTIMFQLTWNEMIRIGKVVLFFLILAGMMLSLHFSQEADSMQSLTASTVYIPWMKMLPIAVSMCAYSLSLHSLGLSTIGSCASDRVKRSIVPIAIITPLLDFAFSLIFSISKIKRRNLVQNMCNVTSVEIERSMDMVIYRTLNSRESDLWHSHAREILELMVVIVLLREDPIPMAWVLCMLFALVIVTVTTVICCLTLFLMPLEVFRTFIRETSAEFFVNITRFTQVAILVLAELLSLHDIGRDFLVNLKLAMMVTFFAVKMLDSMKSAHELDLCKFLRDRRNMIPARQVVERAIFDFYLAPAMGAVLVFGYPIVLVLIILQYTTRELLTDGSLAYAMLIGLVPVLITKLSRFIKAKKKRLHGEK